MANWKLLWQDCSQESAVVLSVLDKSAEHKQLLSLVNLAFMLCLMYLPFVLQTQDWLPEQHFSLPHPVAGPSCLSCRALSQAVSLQDVPGKAEPGTAAACLPATPKPACKRCGTQQIPMLSRNPILILGEAGACKTSEVCPAAILRVMLATCTVCMASKFYYQVFG